MDDPAQEARLTYRPLYGRLEGEQLFPDGRALLLWMSEAIFERHVRAHITETYGRTATPEQVKEVREHCMGFAFWKSVTDPEVHLRRIGDWQREDQ